MANNTSVSVRGIPQLQRNLSSLERQVFPDAATRAVNRVAATMRSRSGSSIAAAMGAKVGAVKKRITLRKARRGSKPEAKLFIKGEALNLIEFRARQTKKGVSAAAWANRKVYPRSFIATIGGNRIVMIRRKIGGSMVGRLPIRPMKGPGVAGMANTDPLAREREEILAQEMPKRLEHELARLVSRLRR